MFDKTKNRFHLCYIMQNTKSQYNEVINLCRTIFLKKNEDYGTSWRLFRPSSLTDQIYIKAQRIKNIEQSGNNAVGDDIISEFMGIVNYSIIALIQLEMIANKSESDDIETIANAYDHWANKTRDLMLLKNSDYSEVWREMRISSFTDLILVKIARIKQIEDNLGKVSVSEGADANYQDIINYAIFALIRL
jgi:hypothetical protein